MQKHFDKTQCRQKGISTLAGIIIIVIVAAVLFGGVFVYQYFLIKSQNTITNIQSSPKSQNIGIDDWKTYTNQEVGFSIQYPTDWHVDIPMTPGGVAFSAYFFCSDATQGCTGNESEVDIFSYIEQPKNIGSGVHYLGFSSFSKLYFYSSDSPNTDTKKYNNMISTFKFTK